MYLPEIRHDVDGFILSQKGHDMELPKGGRSETLLCMSGTIRAYYRGAAPAFGSGDSPPLEGPNTNSKSVAPSVSRPETHFEKTCKWNPMAWV